MSEEETWQHIECDQRLRVLFEWVGEKSMENWGSIGVRAEKRSSKVLDSELSCFEKANEMNFPVHIMNHEHKGLENWGKIDIEASRFSFSVTHHVMLVRTRPAQEGWEAYIWKLHLKLVSELKFLKIFSNFPQDILIFLFLSIFHNLNNFHGWIWFHLMRE